MAKSKKSFWRRPEGFTGGLFLAAILGGLGYAVVNSLDVLTQLMSNTLYLAGMIGGVLMIFYMIADPKMRKLVSYAFRSSMRAITSIFIQLDPIAILKGYLDDLKKNLSKMTSQINMLRSQMHKIQEIIFNNSQQIEENLELAREARDREERNQMILKSRKAGRLKDSNMKYEDLYRKMEVLYKVLVRMKDNSEIMYEDVKDQVDIKEQEYKAIKSSHSAMKSAMNIINGNKDKKAMFDEALEAVADDVSNKVGEMERFMELSEDFMEGIDLQNGVFEEEGLKLLEQWEKEGTSLLLGEEKETLLLEDNVMDSALDLNKEMRREEKVQIAREGNQYDKFFEE